MVEATQPHTTIMKIPTRTDELKDAFDFWKNYNTELAGTEDEVTDDEKASAATRARTVLVEKEGYATEDFRGEPSAENVSDWIVKEHNLKKFDNAKDAESALLPGTDYYINPATKHMPHGVFMTTPSRDLTIAETFREINKKAESHWDAETAAKVRLKHAAFIESLGVGTVELLAGTMKLPYMYQMYALTGMPGTDLSDMEGWDTTVRVMADALIPAGPKEGTEFTNVSKQTVSEISELLQGGAPFKGKERYLERLERAPQKAIMKHIDVLVAPYRKAIEMSIGTPSADWPKYWETRVTKLSAEIFLGGRPAFYGAKALIHPIKTATRIASSVRNMSLSNAFGKASATVERGPKALPEGAVLRVDRLGQARIPKSTRRKIIEEADASMGGAIAYETTKNIVGEDSPYAELIALPMMLFGSISTPSKIGAKGAKTLPFVRNGYLNNKVRFMSWWYGGYKGGKDPVSGLIIPKSPMNDPVKAAKIQSDYLLMRGVPEDEVTKLRKSGELDQKILEMRLHKGAQNDLNKLSAAIQQLRIDDPEEFTRLTERMDKNFEVFTQLQKVAKDHLPPGSQESVHIYIGALTEISWMQNLQTQLLHNNEGFRLFKNIRLDAKYLDLQRSQEYLRDANIKLLRDIQKDANMGDLNPDDFNAFIDFATEAQRRVQGEINDSATKLIHLLKREKVKRGIAESEEAVNLNNILHPPSARERMYQGVEGFNYRVGQRNIIKKVYHDDRDIINTKFGGALDVNVGGTKYNFLDFELDASSLRDHMEELRRSPEGTDIEVLSFLSDYANTGVKTRTVKGVSKQLTREGLEGSTKDELITLVQEADSILYPNRTTPVDYSNFTDGQLIRRILTDEVQTTLLKSDPELLAANITVRELKDLMSKLGEEYISNIGTRRGRSAMSLWQKANELIDPDSPTWRDQIEEMVTETEPSKRAEDIQQLLAASTGLKAAKEFFKNEFVPRWKVGIGEKIMTPQGQAGYVPDEVLFKQFFANSDQIEERGETFRLILHRLEREGSVLKPDTRTGEPVYGTLSKRSEESEEEMLRYLKYGLFQHLDSGNLTPGQIDRILTTYGSQGGTRRNILTEMDPNLEESLKKYRQKISKEYGISEEQMNENANNIIDSIKELQKSRASVLKESGLNEIANIKSPEKFFTDQSVFVKTSDLSVEDKARFADLIESVKIGETGPFGTGSEEAASALAKLEGKTGTGTISMTPYRFLEELTRGADGTPFTLKDNAGREIGKEMLEKIRVYYYQDIIDSSLKLTGKKRIIDTTNDLGERVPIMDEMIDFNALSKKLEKTKHIREKIFSDETNKMLDQVLENESILATSTAMEEMVKGLPTPYRLSSWMARGFAIARGVLSLRYFAGELTLQHMRLQYVNMMKEILTDPDGGYALMKMVPIEQRTKWAIDEATAKPLEYMEGIRTLSKFMGIEASRLAGISEEDYNHIVLHGAPSAKSYKMASARADKASEKRILREQKRVSPTDPLRLQSIEQRKKKQKEREEMRRLFG